MLKQITLNPPMQRQAGDVVERVGHTLEQRRNGVLVRSWDLRTAQEATQTFATQSTVTTLFFEVGMPGQNVSMTNIRENQTTGAIVVDFSSGSQQEFSSWDAVGEIADSIDAAPGLAEKILLGKAYRASPDGTNKTTQIGASVSVNLSANEPIVYTDANA